METIYKNPSVDLINLKRSKLLMSAAKELLLKKKFLGKSDGAISQQRLNSLMLHEERLEMARHENPREYKLNEHISILATLIEQAQIMTQQWSRQELN